MSNSRRTTPGVAVVGAALLAGCATDSVTSPSPVTDATPVAPAFSQANGLACQTITFNEGGLVHGGIVTSIGLSGMTVGFSVVPYEPDDWYPREAPAGTLRAFDTNNTTHPEDTDLMVSENCSQCAGLDNVLIIEHELGFASNGDYRWGGAISLTGIPSTHYIQSFTVLDNENPADFPPPEASVKLFVGGTLVGESSNMGDATVEVVSSSVIKAASGSVVFTFGTEAVDDVGGSGALDNIVICPLPNQGCTPGYWKNHPGAWASTGYSPNQTLESVFDIPDGYGLDGVTLLQALSLTGGPGAQGAAQLLAHHAVAALLNASSSGVSYPRTPEQVVADANTAFASGSRSAMLTLKTSLDDDNQLGCPLN